MENTLELELIVQSVAWQHTPVNTQEAEAGGLPCMQGQPGLHSKALPQKQKETEITQKSLENAQALKLLMHPGP